jgi:hypothetical protein
VVAGTEATYRIDFGNHGPSTATGVHVRDTLPDGFVFDRCEPIDPNDQVTCTAAGQQVTLESVQRANSVVYADGDVLDAGEERGFYLVAGVSSGYILDGRTDAAQGQMCYAYFGATDYPYWAHDRAAISANEDADQAAALGRNNFDDECTRVAALADLAVAKLDDLAGFMECDPVGRGGTITYDLYVSNNGPSDAAQAYLVDWLPSYGAVLDPTWVKVSVDGGHGEVVEVRDDGRITVAVGDDPNGQSLVQLGRMNAGGVPVHVIIQVEAMDRPGVCSLDLVNSAIVETRRSDTLWPVVDGSMYAPTPTADPDPTNNRDEETTRVECPAIEVNKTISTTGECPGSEYQVIAQPGVTLTFCLEIKNTGTTYLDNIRITDRIIGTRRWSCRAPVSIRA